MFEASVPVSLVLADRSCQALERSTQAGVEPLLVARTNFGPDFDRLGYTEKVVNELQDRHIDLIVMAGFGTVFSEPVHAAYGGRIINTHPSLLPAFPGLNTHHRALNADVKLHGCTVHFVRAAMDSGPIIAQAAVPVLAGDTPGVLAARVLAVEHVLYPKALAVVAADRVRVVNELCVFADRPADLDGPSVLVSPPGI